VQKDNFAFIEELWRRWSPDLPTSIEALLHVKEIFSDPQLLHNALAYYRGMLTPALTELAQWNRSRELSFADVTVPTLTLTGSSDGCIVPEMFEGMHTAIQNEFTLRILPTAGHFLTLESDERIATEISRFTENYAEVKHA
jgi:pimeloyl-ACP methyl ester carboxylesterase